MRGVQVWEAKNNAFKEAPHWAPVKFSKGLMLWPWLAAGALVFAVGFAKPGDAKYILVSHATDLVPALALAAIVWALCRRQFTPWGAYAVLLLPAAFGGGFPDYAHGAGFLIEHFTVIGVGHKSLAYRLFHRHFLPNLIVMPLAILVGLGFLWLGRRLGLAMRTPQWWPIAAAALGLLGALVHVYIMDEIGF